MISGEENELNESFQWIGFEGIYLATSIKKHSKQFYHGLNEIIYFSEV